VTDPRHPATGRHEPDPDTVATVVSACPAVLGLSGGRFGEVATYLPGRRVSGVRITPEQVEVHVIGRLGVPISEIADQIRTALNPVARHHSVLVRPTAASALPPPTRSDLS